MASRFRRPSLPHRLLIGGLCFSVAALCGATGAVASRPGTVTDATVSVTVFNYAAIPDAELTVTLATIERLLGFAGVQVRWLRCTPGVEPTPRACHSPIGPAGLALRLVPTAPGVPESREPLQLGFAVLDDAGVGVMATVYLDRVSRLGRMSSMAPEWVAGLVATHELGHLLLGSTGHGDRGLMRALWSARDLRGTHLTDWRFSPIEAARLRATAARREPVGAVVDAADQEPGRDGHRHVGFLGTTPASAATERVYTGPPRLRRNRCAPNVSCHSCSRPLCCTPAAATTVRRHPPW